MSWKLEFYGEILHLTTLWWAAMPAILHHESSISKLNALYPYCLLHIAYFVCCPIPNASNIAPSKLNIKVESSISLLPIAYFAY